MFIRLVTYTNLVLISQLLKELLRILSKIISFFNDLLRVGAEKIIIEKKEKRFWKSHKISN